MAIGDNFDTTPPGFRNQTTRRVSGHGVFNQYDPFTGGTHITDDNLKHPCNVGCGCKTACHEGTILDPEARCQLPPELTIYVTRAGNRDGARSQIANGTLTNLFSKKNEGGELHVQGPNASATGFKCRCRIVSVDFPSHTPGNPQISTYTITLEADQLLGPASGNDEDDWQRLGKWLISSASENWSIAENEGGKVITMGSGPVTKVEKTYTLTRNLSATGKGKFKITPAADGLKTTDSFSTAYDETGKEGEAWQQARGFVYEIIVYGNTFLNDETYEGERDKNGINLPANYEGYNYVRSETIDELGGTFSATESWILLPTGHSSVTETVETSISQSQDTGVLKVSINGNIQGMGTENTDETLPGDEAADTVVDFDGTLDSKYAKAKARLTAIEGNLYLTAQALLRDSAEHVKVTLNPSPLSKTIGRNPYTGVITYSLEFDNRPTFAIPGVKSETISINDTYPGYVAAVTQVIGRAIGPVLQSIGTQTKWQRSLSISCVVDTSPGSCAGALDSSGDPVDPDNEEDCDGAATAGTWTGFNPLGDPKTDFYAGAMAAKPSHVPAQRAAIVSIIDKFNPSTAPASTATGATLNVFFTEAPSETWDPRTGAWSYTVSWVYEPSRSYQFLTSEPNAPYPKTYI